MEEQLWRHAVAEKYGVDWGGVVVFRKLMVVVYGRVLVGWG